MLKRPLNILIVAVLSVFMVGCSNTTKSPSESTGNQARFTDTQVLEYAKRLSDAAVNKYTGRDYEEEFSSALMEINAEQKNPSKIYLERMAEDTMWEMLEQGKNAVYVLPGPYSVLDRLGWPPGYDMDEDLINAIFPEGEGPNISPAEASGEIKPAFESWFIKRAMETGYMDKRLNYDSVDGTIYVKPEDCTPAKGGTKFKLYDYEFTVDLEEELMGKTMEVDTFIYYDVGSYSAVYSGEGVKLEVTITFTEKAGKFESDIERYLAGVRDIKVIERK